MELIYIWIDKFRTFTNTGINFSARFDIDFNKDNMEIVINKNENYISLYPENIKNISLILGKNSSGKTNLLDLIGTRIDNRNERRIVYKEKQNSPFRRIDEKRDIFKEARYFMIYYMGVFDGEEIFCFEGNDIEKYNELIENKSIVDIKYFNEKYWFSLICKKKI